MLARAIPGIALSLPCSLFLPVPLSDTILGWLSPICLNIPSPPNHGRFFPAIPKNLMKPPESMDVRFGGLCPCFSAAGLPDVAAAGIFAFDLPE
jgi:hypothetical protein